MGPEIESEPEIAAMSRCLPELAPGMTANEPLVSPIGVIFMAAWFGLATGLLELIVTAAKWSWDQTVFQSGKVVSRHYLWMIPIADLVMFGVCGLGLSCFARFWPRAAHRVASYLLCGLGFLAVLLNIRRLHIITYVLLACGFASLLAPTIGAHAAGFRKLARRSFPGLVGIVAILACFSFVREMVTEHRALSRLPAAVGGAPNVLLIVLDTVRADALSLHGYGRDTSPNLARLAREGVRFENARSTAPWTLPSHASMFTGRWPHQLSAAKERALDATEPTLAEVLSKRGYATAGFVANSIYCHSAYGLSRGFAHYEDIPISALELFRCNRLGRAVLTVGDKVRFKFSEAFGAQGLSRVFGDDSFLSLRRKDAARINRDALDWLGAHHDRPFFVFLNYFDAHDSYFAPKEAERHFGLTPETPSDKEIIRTFPSAHANSVRATGAAGGPRQASRLLQLARDSYDDCIAYLDSQVGRLFNELDHRGMLENTVVLITADHGESFGEHERLGHWQTLYRPEIWVPLLVIAPRRAPSGQSVSAPVSLRDIPATVLDLAGVGGKSTLPGRSLARFWKPEIARDTSGASPILSEFVPESGADQGDESLWKALSLGEMVYIRNAEGHEELYNITDDPDETRNLIEMENARHALEDCRAKLDRIGTEGRSR